MSRSSCLGRAEWIMTGFYLTMTAVFVSHTSRYSTYLSFLRVCEDLAVKGQSSGGPRVHSQGGEGKRLPLISLRTIVLIGILVWNIAIMYFRNPLQNFSKAKGWTAWGLGVLIMVFSSMVNLWSCHQLSTPLSQLYHYQCSNEKLCTGMYGMSYWWMGKGFEEYRRKAPSGTGCLYWVRLICVSVIT